MGPIRFFTWKVSLAAARTRTPTIPILAGQRRSPFVRPPVGQRTSSKPEAHAPGSDTGSGRICLKDELCPCGIRTPPRRNGAARCGLFPSRSDGVPHAHFGKVSKNSYPVAGRAGASAACERRDEDRRRAASAGPKQRLVLADRLLDTGPRVAWDPARRRSGRVVHSGPFHRLQNDPRGPPAAGSGPRLRRCGPAMSPAAHAGGPVRSRQHGERRTCASTAPTRRSAAPAPVPRRAAHPLQRCGLVWLHARPDQRRPRASPSGSPGAPRTEPRSATPPRLVGLDEHSWRHAIRSWMTAQPLGPGTRAFGVERPCGCRRRAEDLPAADTYDGVEPALRRALYAWAQPYLHRHGSRDEASAITGWGDPQAARP